MGCKKPPTNVESRFEANQVNETYVVKETDMVRYLETVKTLTNSFKSFSIKQVPRSENKKVDALSKIASSAGEGAKGKVDRCSGSVGSSRRRRDTWMTPIFKYLIDETLPVEVKKARAVSAACTRWVQNGSIMAKALRIGYYWSTTYEDARKLIRACHDCQVHKPIPRSPQQNLIPITSSWTFYKWGIDIAGPFSEGPGRVKFLIVAIDYFIKWIEAKPVATITGNQIKKFMWDNIVCRFGLPGEIISDNGKKFQDNPFKDWCEKLCIRQHFASVKHPQTNGLVERANRVLGEGS
ncbi:reverse transcriptase domain-containing protein [Tanacetum coccineum]